MWHGDVPETAWSSETSSDLEESLRSTMRGRAYCEPRRERKKSSDQLILIGANANEARNSPNLFPSLSYQYALLRGFRGTLPSTPWGECDTDLFVST
jgi:hypothetical protein